MWSIITSMDVWKWWSYLLLWPSSCEYLMINPLTIRGAPTHFGLMLAGADGVPFSFKFTPHSFYLILRCLKLQNNKERSRPNYRNHSTHYWTRLYQLIYIYMIYIYIHVCIYIYNSTKPHPSPRSPSALGMCSPDLGATGRSALGFGLGGNIAIFTKDDVGEWLRHILYIYI